MYFLAFPFELVPIPLLQPRYAGDRDFAMIDSLERFSKILSLFYLDLSRIKKIQNRPLHGHSHYTEIIIFGKSLTFLLHLTLRPRLADRAPVAAYKALYTLLRFRARKFCLKVAERNDLLFFIREQIPCKIKKSKFRSSVRFRTAVLIQHNF